MPEHDHQDIVVLFSRQSRDAYAIQAAERGETYTFTDAWGLPRTWVKGEYAYLAPNAAELLLARCNLKHHLVEEAELDDARLARCRALIVANAAHLAPETIARIERWLGGDRRLIVTGKTNLPPALLGLRSCTPAPVKGYTGWRWRPGSPFSGDAWEPLYVSGYERHPVNKVEPAAGSRVLADVVELTGDLTDATTTTVAELGPGIVLSERTVYVANQVLELIGGMMQAHLNVEPVRHWANATHWGDTLLLFLRRLMLEVGLAPLWQTRLRSFGTYDGVLSFRHDVHGMRDYTFLDYQIQNLIPASYDIEDPTFSTNIDEAMARDWVERTTQHSFIEPALHNDSSIGDPPTAIFGKGLFEHVSKASTSLGITICTCGRHAGGHMHPETIDAMDYLYAHDTTILGLCTFCYYHMIEYGVRDPNVMVGGTIGEKPLTYVTDVRRTIATSGIWFPFRPVVTTDKEWRKLRGWDRTHEYDAAYELVETIFAGRNARRPGLDDRLENGVYSFQYHPELARDPSVNNGKGTLDYVRYCINLAERRNYWIATQAELYQRMADYEALGFDVRDGGREVTITNPTDRRIAAMVLEQRLRFGSVWLGDEELIHVADGAFVTIPPLDAGTSITLTFKPDVVEAPLVRQPSNKGLVVLDARHDPKSGEARLKLSVCRQQPLSVEGVDPEGVYRVQIENQPAQDVLVRTVRTIQALLSEKTDAAKGRSRRAVTPGTTRFLDLVVEGEDNRFVERTLRIRQLPADEARPIRQALIAAIPEKRGRVT
ncbi:MAG: hypothetical protein ISP49_09800 [Reyranella sp.]|nr:hypothetical protein [Reyranella sp.]MBL6651874.1 hypothetical protein [Reyranella sp.]